MSTIADWTNVRGWMLPAINETHGTHTEEDIVALLLVGKFRLWVGRSYAALTEFIQFPRMKTLNIFLVGGESQQALGDLWADSPALVEYAKANGCSRITGAGRVGWSKLPDGFVLGGVYMHKDI